MSTWPTDEAREAVPCTRVCDDSGRRMHGMRHTSGCAEHRSAVLAALAPHVAALVRAERAAALRDAADAALAPSDDLRAQCRAFGPTDVDASIEQLCDGAPLCPAAMEGDR